jgi:hypothetical protein
VSRVTRKRGQRTFGRGRPSSPPVAVDPAKRHAGRARRPTVRLEVVTDVERLPWRDAEGGKGILEDARVGLPETAALRGHDDVEQPAQPRGLEPPPLHAIDAVRDDREPMAPREGDERAPTSGEEVGPPGEVRQIELTEGVCGSGIGPESPKQPSEALSSESRLPNRPAAVARPEGVVDPAVRLDHGRASRQPVLRERRAQGPAFRKTKVQERLVEVEQDGPRSLGASSLGSGRHGVIAAWTAARVCGYGAGDGEGLVRRTATLRDT